MASASSIFFGHRLPDPILIATRRRRAPNSPSRRADAAARIASSTRNTGAMIGGVDEVIELSTGGLARIMAGGWDQVYSVSNDPESAAERNTSPTASSLINRMRSLYADTCPQFGHSDPSVLLKTQGRD